MSLIRSVSPAKIPVDLVDDHDEVYEIWKSRGIYKATLIHLDQHADFQWIQDRSADQVLESTSLQEVQDRLGLLSGVNIGQKIHQSMHIGNYLTRVFQEKMVSKWYWVVPDPQWKSSHRKYEIWQTLLQLYRDKTGPMDFPRVVGNTFRTSLWGVETIVCGLDDLPVFSEQVLLNIDVDYLAVQSRSKLPKADQVRRELPWIWPEDLHRKITAKEIKPLSVAISHSVHGGFTPIQMKYFGECLKVFFEQKDKPANYEDLKKLWESIHRNKSLKELLIDVESFKATGGFEATRLFWVSYLRWQQKAFDKSKEAYQSAALIDADFLTVDSCYAVSYEMEGRYREAFTEYKKMEKLLPQTVWPKMGVAHYHLLRKEWRASVAKYNEVIHIDPHHAGAHRMIGQVYLQTGHTAKAIEMFERSVQLNPSEPETYLGLGESCIVEGKYDQAKKFLREALRMGWHKPKTYALLGEIYLRIGNFSKAADCYFESFRLRLLIAKFRFSDFINQFKSI